MGKQAGHFGRMGKVAVGSRAGGYQGWVAPGCAHVEYLARSSHRWIISSLTTETFMVNQLTSVVVPAQKDTAEMIDLETSHSIVGDVKKGGQARSSLAHGAHIRG